MNNTYWRLILFIFLILLWIVYRSKEYYVPNSNEDIKLTPTTFVSAYYKVPNKYKDRPDVYLEWATNIVRYVRRAQFVIFSTGEALTLLQKLAKDNTNIHFVDLPMEQFKTAQYLEKLKQQKDLDPEQGLHTVELYMIWNEKPHFVERAIDLNVYNSTHYCWIDIGCVRDSRLSSVMLDFPNSSSLAYLGQKDKMCVLGIKPRNLKYFKQLDRPFTIYAIAGGFMFGSKSQFKMYIERYRNLFEKCIQQDIFVGKEQNLINHLVVEYPQDFMIVRASTFKNWLNRFQKDKWFYMINLLSGLEKDRHVNTPFLHGGLGNQLFQLAAVYGISRKQKHIMVLNSSWIDSNPHSSTNYLNTIFSRFLQESRGYFYLDWILTYFNLPSKIYRSRESHEFNPELKDYELYHGYFQNYHYFEPYLDELRLLLELPKVPETNRAFIHIRLGDYVNNTFHYIDLEKYYRRCIQYFDPRVEFCVFSNDPQQASEYVQKLGITNYTFGSQDEITALAEMTQCTLGGICANSTYSWWGAVLNSKKDNKIYFPRQIYPPNSPYYKFDITGLFHSRLTIVDTDR